jgi:ATP-binding cassette subfamily F protein uup
MTIFTLRSIKKDFGIKELLTDASFSLDEEDKVGLTGTNGSGKSTLLKMIAGLESIDSGDRWVNPGSKIVYLPQQPDLDGSHQYRSQNHFLTQFRTSTLRTASLIKRITAVTL